MSANAIEELNQLRQRRVQVVRLMSREDLQILMDFLKRHFILNPPSPGTRGLISMKDVAVSTGISPSTLYYYKSHLERNPAYNPRDRFELLGRAMSDQLEEELILEIDRTYITPGYYFNNQVLKTLAVAMWIQADESDRYLPSFRASDKWCRNFRRRHGYVWRKAVLVRKVKQTTQDIQRIEEFSHKIRDLRTTQEENDQLDLLVNMDETSWRLSYTGDMTWAKKGSPSTKINVDFDTKDCFTTVAAITASGKKLPLYVLASGLTERCEKGQVKIETEHEYATDHSKTGWVTEDVMKRYLKWLRNQMNTKFDATGKRIHLVLDLYTAHRTRNVKNLARRNQIILHYLPAGCTDTLQPLDRRVFGALKAKARSLWYKEYACNPNLRHTKKAAVKTLLSCWAELSDHLITAAWMHYGSLLNREADDDAVVSSPSIRSPNEMREVLRDSMQEVHDRDPQYLGELFQNEIMYSDRRGDHSEDTPSADHATIVDAHDAHEARQDSTVDEAEEDAEEDMEEDTEEEEASDGTTQEGHDEMDHREEVETEKGSENDHETEEEDDEMSNSGDNMRIHTELGIEMNENEEARPDNIPDSLKADGIFEAGDYFLLQAEAVIQKYRDDLSSNDNMDSSSDDPPEVREIREVLTVKELYIKAIPIEFAIQDQEAEKARLDVRIHHALQHRKNRHNRHPSVGIKNMGSSSAFNCFMQLVNLIPSEASLIRPSPSSKFTINDFICIFRDYMQTSLASIDMTRFINNLSETNGLDLRSISQMLSNEENTVTQFIDMLIDLDKITFILNGSPKHFLDVSLGNSLINSLKAIDLESIKPFMFVSVSYFADHNSLPRQLQIENSHMRVYFVLKAFITKKEDHHVSYIRCGFSMEMLCVDDHHITIIKHPSFDNITLALYFTYKQPVIQQVSRESDSPEF